MALYLDTSKNQVFGSLNEKYSFIQDTLKHGSCPLTVRKMIEASFSAQSGNDDRNIRSKNFTATFLAIWPTLVMRVVRAVVWSVALPIRLPYLAYKADKYRLDLDQNNNPTGISTVRLDLKRVGYEWRDLAESIRCWGITAINTFVPSGFKATIQNLQEYYVTRVLKDKDDALYVKNKIKLYEARHTENVRARKVNTDPVYTDRNHSIDKIPVPSVRLPKSLIS